MHNQIVSALVEQLAHHSVCSCYLLLLPRNGCPVWNSAMHLQSVQGSQTVKIGANIQAHVSLVKQFVSLVSGCSLMKVACHCASTASQAKAGRQSVVHVHVPSDAWRPWCSRFDRTCIHMCIKHSSSIECTHVMGGHCAGGGARGQQDLPPRMPLCPSQPARKSRGSADACQGGPPGTGACPSKCPPSPQRWRLGHH